MSSCAAPPLGVAGEHRAELGDLVPRHDAGLDAGRQLAAVARLLPVVAEEVARGASSVDRDLRLARPVGAHQRDVLPVAQRARPGRARSRPGVTVTTMSAASASLERARDAGAERARRRARARAGSTIPDERRRAERARTSAPSRRR